MYMVLVGVRCKLRVSELHVRELRGSCAYLCVFFFLVFDFCESEGACARTESISLTWGALSSGRLDFCDFFFVDSE